MNGPRASIYDQLQELAPPVAAAAIAKEARHDFSPDRLWLVDGVALTPAGLVARGVLPAAASPVMSPFLRAKDGSRVLVYAIEQALPASRLDALAGIEPKANRLWGLLKSLMPEVLTLLDRLPEGERFDLIFTAPLHTPQAIDIWCQRLERVFKDSGRGDALQRVEHRRASADLHDSLAVTEAGAMAWVLWLSIDSLLDAEGLAALLDHRMRRGEAAVALLFERPGDDQAPPPEAWLLERAAAREHEPRSSLGNAARAQVLKELIETAWGASASQAMPAPACLVIDALGLPGCAAETGRALMACWPALDVLGDAVDIDLYCGWPGEAAGALQLMLAMAELKATGNALVLNVADEQRSRAQSLRALASRRPSADPAQAPLA